MADVSTTAAVRQQIAAHLATGYGLTRECPEPVPFMRVPGRSPVHLEFGVDVSASAPSARSTQTNSAVTVLIAYQLPPKDRVAGYDAMLVADGVVRDAMLLSAWSNGPRLAEIYWTGTTRPSGIDGWIWIEQTYRALHLT